MMEVVQGAVACEGRFGRLLDISYKSWERSRFDEDRILRNQDWYAGSCIRLGLKEGTGRKVEARRLL